VQKDLTTKTSNRQGELDELLLDWRKCKRCPLYRNRKVPILPFGKMHPGSQVALVLDRLHLGSMYGDPLEDSSQIWILDKMLGYLGDGLSAHDLWVTPTTLCPTRGISPTDKAPDMMPFPRTNHTRECRERLHREVHILQPKVLIACGSEALKALHTKNPPKYKEVFGTVSEVYIQGDLVPYAVPVMTTYSISHLDRVGQSDPQVWDKFYTHLGVALDIAKQLENLETGNDST